MKKVPTVKQIIRIIESFAPRELALEGDPVGLQCGEVDKPVRKLMVSLDAGLGPIEQAAEYGADMLVTHHPLLYEPLTSSNMHGAAGRALARSISENIAVYSSHTNLDASPDGINDFLADLLELQVRIPLQGTGPDPLKVVVTVPPGDLDRVRQAAFQAGGGWIGRYSGCSFSSEGVGTFHPEEGADPAVGSRGRDEKVPEARFELTVGSEVLGAVISALRGAHPYEEPAIDVYPLFSHSARAGFGIVGMLPGRATVGQLSSKLHSALKPGSMRLVGKMGMKVRRVAVCAGSGASLLDKAIEAGAQLYITGDIKYHDARKAEDAGINLLDAGHFAPEKYGIGLFGRFLEKKMAQLGFVIEMKYAKERDPFVSLS